MQYEGNPKHKDPWQRGRQGSLCPKTIGLATAQQLLEHSELEGQARYAVYEGRAYCARQHGNDLWHGYPIGWSEVPPGIRTHWEREGRVTRRDIKKHWD